MNQVRKHLQNADERVKHIIEELGDGGSLQVAVERFMSVHLWVRTYWRSADEQICLAFPKDIMKKLSKKTP